MRRSLHISEALRIEIERLARAGYPEEICGLLLGGAAESSPTMEPAHFEVLGLHAAANAHATNRLHRYEVPPADYWRAEAAAREAGMEIIGVFHSHPDSPAIPSSIDAEFAFPGWLYWITPVAEGHCGEPRAWLRLWDEEQWVEIGVGATDCGESP